MDKRYCLKCEKELLPIGGEDKVNLRRIYCDSRCRSQYLAMQRYNKIKDTSEYKQYRRKYFKSWRLKNREKFNSLVRPHSKAYQTRKRLNDKNEKRMKDS